MFIILALLQHGADPNIRNSENKSPLDIADPCVIAVLQGEYRKDELLEAARTGAEERLLSLLTPLNVNCKLAIIFFKIFHFCLDELLIQSQLLRSIFKPLSILNLLRSCK